MDTEWAFFTAYGTLSFWCDDLESRLDALRVLMALQRGVGPRPPRRLCRPDPAEVPIARLYGLPVYVDPTLPRGTWYVLGVAHPDYESDQVAYVEWVTA